MSTSNKTCAHQNKTCPHQYYIIQHRSFLHFQHINSTLDFNNVKMLYLLSLYFITNTYLHLYIHTRLRHPREAVQIFVYIPRTIWTTRQLIVPLTFEDHWPHDLHDLVERCLTFITILVF